MGATEREHDADARIDTLIVQDVDMLPRRRYEGARPRPEAQPRIDREPRSNTRMILDEQRAARGTRVEPDVPAPRRPDGIGKHPSRWAGWIEAEYGKRPPRHRSGPIAAVVPAAECVVGAELQVVRHAADSGIS